MLQSRAAAATHEAAFDAPVSVARIPGHLPGGDYVGSSRLVLNAA